MHDRLPTILGADLVPRDRAVFRALQRHCFQDFDLAVAATEYPVITLNVNENAVLWPLAIVRCTGFYVVALPSAVTLEEDAAKRLPPVFASALQFLGELGSRLERILAPMRLSTREWIERHESERVRSHVVCSFSSAIVRFHSF